MLDEAPQRWTGGGDLFFVGNVAHYPNRRAIEWIAQRLAPALDALGCKAKLRIIGAVRGDLSAAALSPNLEFLGPATRADVLANFLSCSLFLAPIENKFGSKIKLLEAVSFGTPFAASASARSGLPGLSAPVLDLDAPASAARQIAELLARPEAVRAVSATISAYVGGALIDQRRRWEQLLLA
jgi:glycosyltransferase involved in cell wall biosynthesis